MATPLALVFNYGRHYKVNASRLMRRIILGDCIDTVSYDNLLALMNFKVRLTTPWRHSLIVFLSARVVASVLALVGLSSIPLGQGAIKLTGASRLYDLTFGLWNQWDVGWYTRIANEGYSAQSAAFMPFFPLLMRCLHEITGLGLVSCGILISNAATIIAFVLLFQLIAYEWDDQVAKRTLWLQAFFPGSLFFVAPYTESLFLALAVGAFWFARRGFWMKSAVCVFFAGITRNLGVFLILALAYEFFKQKKEGKQTPWIHVCWLLIGPLGLAAYMAFLYLKTGDALAFVSAQSYWMRKSQFAFKTVWLGIQQAWFYSGSYPGGVYILEAGAVVGALAAGVLAFQHLRFSYTLFLWIGLLLPLSASFEGRALGSCVRFIAVLFPFFMVIGKITKNPSVERFVLSLFISLYGLSVALFVTGHWFY